MNLFTKEKQTYRLRELRQLMVTRGKMRRRDRLGVWN